MIFRYDTLDSSNDELRRRFLAGQAAAGDVVWAREQYAARGRTGRSYVCRKDGGLWFSVLLQPRCAPEDLPMLTPRVAVELVRVLERECPLTDGLRYEIKWPNDILAAGKKICGILCEALPCPGGGFAVIAGIGLNLREDCFDGAPELRDRAAALAAFCAEMPEAEALLASFAGALAHLGQGFPAGHEEALAQYGRHLAYEGRTVALLPRDGVGEGLRARVLGTGEDFSLRVALENGEEENIRSGELSLREAE